MAGRVWRRPLAAIVLVVLEGERAASGLPVFSLNFVMITASELWALRYPAVHELHVLERAAGGASGNAQLHHRNAQGSVRVHSAHLAERPAVIVASEPMDDDPAGGRSTAVSCCTSTAV